MWVKDFFIQFCHLLIENKGKFYQNDQVFNNGTIIFLQKKTRIENLCKETKDLRTKKFQCI